MSEARDTGCSVLPDMHLPRAAASPTPARRSFDREPEPEMMAREDVQVAPPFGRQVSVASSAVSSGSAAPPDVTSVPSWSPAEVAQWLRCIGLGNCAEVLLPSSIGGAALLGLAASPTPSADLVALGMRALGDRKRLLKAIRQLEVDTMQVTGGQDGPWALHFMFMSASPLVQLAPSGAVALRALDVEAEQNAICQATADAGVACRFQYVNATLRSLSWAVLHQSCCVLIFSGHTPANGQWLLETETGEALPFDPLDMLPQAFSPSSSSTAAPASAAAAAAASTASAPTAPPSSALASAPALVPAMSSEAAAAEAPLPLGAPWQRSLSPVARFRLVLVHAEFPHISAQRFLDAGVPHVVAVRRASSEAGIDVGATVFLQALCHSLLRGGSVEHAFRHAVRLARHSEGADQPTFAGRSSSSTSLAAMAAAAAEEKVPGEGVEERFALLPASACHAEILLPALTPSLPVRCSPARAACQFPRTGLDLVSTRRVEMWRVLRALRCRRLVQVLGPPGVGKRNLACFVSNYVWQRHVFKDGVHYVHVDDLHQASAAAHLAAPALNKASEAGPEEEAGPEQDPEEEEAPPRSRSPWASRGDNFLAHTPVLPGHKLLVLDGCEELYRRRRHDDFVDWLARLLTENPELQLLITARTHLRVSTDHSRDPLLGNLEDHTVDIRELIVDDAVRFLRWLCRGCRELKLLLDEHAARVVALCAFLPFTISLFATWAVMHCSEQDPVSILLSLEASARRGDGGADPVLGFVVGALPRVLRAALGTLVREVDCSFSAARAAEVLAIPVAEAEARLAALRARQLLEASDSASMAARLMPPEAQALTPTPPTSFRIHELVRAHMLGLDGDDGHSIDSNTSVREEGRPEPRAGPRSAREHLDPLPRRGVVDIAREAGASPVVACHS